MSKTSVIIPTMKGREDKLKKLLSTLPPDCERIIVDDENLLLAAKRNKGAKQAKGTYLLFIDDDNYLKDGAISEILNSFTEEIGVMGMTACYHNKKMIVADGGSYRYFISGFTSGRRTNQNAFEETEIYEVDEAANAFMIRKDVFEDVGGFDEINFPIDLDESDICKRIKDMGYKIVYNPKAICYHDSITYSCIPNFRRPLNAYFMGRNRVLFSRKHSHCHLVYLIIFMPIFVVFYCAALLYRKNPRMIPHFLKGVLDGISGRKQNPYQQI